MTCLLWEGLQPRISIAANAAPTFCYSSPSALTAARTCVGGEAAVLEEARLSRPLAEVGSAAVRRSASRALPAPARASRGRPAGCVQWSRRRCHAPELGADSNGSLPLADTGGDEGVHEACVVREAFAGEAREGCVDLCGVEVARCELGAQLGERVLAPGQEVRSPRRGLDFARAIRWERLLCGAASAANSTRRRDGVELPPAPRVSALVDGRLRLRFAASPPASRHLEGLRQRQRATLPLDLPWRSPGARDQELRALSLPWPMPLLAEVEPGAGLRDDARA